MNELITQLITFIIADFPIVMTVLAVVLGIIACARHRQQSCSDIFLSRLMFFAVGLAGIWGFVMHAFFPELASKYIAWAPSPFEYEVAVANLGLGMSGLFGTRASQGYRIAVTIFATCFLWGAASGHVMQMLKAGNFAPGNAGTIFYNDLLVPLLLIIFLLCARGTNKKLF